MSKRSDRRQKLSEERRKKLNTSGLLPPWQPGQSGNPKGRPKSITLSEAYRVKLAEPFPGTDHTWAEEIAERMAKIALRQVSAATELADRTEGRPPQTNRIASLGPPPVLNVSFITTPKRVVPELKSTPLLEGDNDEQNRPPQ